MARTNRQIAEPCVIAMDARMQATVYGPFEDEGAANNFIAQNESSYPSLSFTVLPLVFPKQAGYGLRAQTPKRRPFKKVS